MLLASLLLSTFLLSDSGGPTAVNIHDVNSVPALVGLPDHAITSSTTLASIPALAGVYIVLAVLLLRSFLLCCGWS
jgi:hypothetical protein